MFDPGDRSQPSEVAAREGAARRDGWTIGTAVELADVETWRLPRIDVVLLLFRPELQAPISRAFDLAFEISQAAPQLDPDLPIHAIFRAQLIRLGAILLRINYDLPDRDWRRLLSFEHPDGMSRMALAVAEAVADSLAAWMPFHPTSCAGGAEGLLFN